MAHMMKQAAMWKMHVCWFDPNGFDCPSNDRYEPYDRKTMAATCKVLESPTVLLSRASNVADLSLSISSFFIWFSPVFPKGKVLYFTPTRRLACSCVSVFEDKCWLLVFYTFESLPSRLGTGHIYNWVFQMGSRILARLLKSSYSIHCASNPISTVAIRCVQFKATRNAFSWHLQSITINYNQQ